MGLGRKKEILEVGAGMGVTGLFLAAFGQNISHLRCGPDAGCWMLDIWIRIVSLSRIKNLVSRIVWLTKPIV
jgi:hypothetical protein